jgi:hypothetical protein
VSAKTLTRGPYMNEDGDWWIAAEDGTQEEAREHIAMCASNSIEFVGIDDGTRMSEHELGDMDCPGHGCSLPQPCFRVGPAYHFREVEEDAQP